MITIHRWTAATRHCEWLSAEMLASPKDSWLGTEDVLWIDLAHPTNEEEQLVLARFFPIHPLSLEDVTKLRREPGTRPHLPKVEEFPDYLFVIMNPLAEAFLTNLHDESDAISGPISTQLSVILSSNILITHHYDSVVGTDHLRAYLNRHEHQAERGPDYMFHLVLDAIVDQYAPTLEQVEERLDGIELTVFEQPDPTQLQRLLRLKRAIILLRKCLHYEREVLARLTRGEFALIDSREAVYYRNVYDHLVRFAELIESSREMVSDLMQTHLAATSNRLSIIMKALTLMSTIVLPMTLVAGVYGMNFDEIPEIHWTYGYPWALGLMALTAISVYWLYRYKKWI